MMHRARLRIRGAYQRRIAKWFGRRVFTLPPALPIVSFTFDDFPRSALLIGGALLKQFHLSGTYYVSLGLANQVIATGEMFHSGDLSHVIGEGHELGCHTFDHHSAWETNSRTYATSVCENARQLKQLGLSTVFQTHSYPISYPRPRTKRQLERHFRGCRGGGQIFNRGTIDLNYLSSFFLEQARGNLGAVERVLAANAEARGWVIFSTHDISPSPTRFGCTPEFFERVVSASLESGARILPMSAALDELGVPAAGER